MSQYQSKFRLDYGKYFDNPPNSVQAPSITGDNNNILNFARTVRNDDTPSGLSTNENKAMIPTTIGDVKAAQSIRDASTKGRKNVQEITKEIGGGITNATGSGITEDLKTVEQTGGGNSSGISAPAFAGAISPDPFPVTVGKTTDSEKAGAMAFSAKSLPVAGALAFNNTALERLKKGDNIKGAGPVTAAAVSALIAAAPQIISAIKDYRNSQTKGGRYIEKCEGCGTFKMYVKGLSDDKVNELEQLCKKIRGQGRYLSGSGVVGSGRFGTFMSNAWNKLKGIYNSEQFKPIKKALLNAANNTATNYINKAADKVASKTGNQDLKDIVNVTRDTALSAKDQLLNNTANGVITGGAVVADNCATSVGGSMIANENADGENVDGIRLFEESICYDPVESTVNTSYTANRLACPRGFLEGAGKCKGYKKGRTTRIAF